MAKKMRIVIVSLCNERFDWRKELIRGLFERIATFLTFSSTVFFFALVFIYRSLSLHFRLVGQKKKSQLEEKLSINLKGQWELKVK